MNLQLSDSPHIQTIQDIEDHHSSPLPPHRAYGVAEKIAVLLSKHPCQSNFHAAGEIRSLRRLGYEIELSALRTTVQDMADLGPEIKAEVEATHYVRKRGGFQTLACHLRGFFNPLPYIRLVHHVIRLDGWSSLIRNRHVADVLDLACWMRQKGIRHVHAHFGTEAAHVAVLMRRLQPVTVSLTLGNSDNLHHVDPDRFKQEVEAADFIICSGIGVRTTLMRLTPHHQWHKYEVCGSGVDTRRFQPRPPRLRPEVFTILCVGPLEPLNGQRTVLEACRMLRQSGRDIRLILVGAGSDECELKKQAETAGIRDYLTFTGMLHQERICDWYNRADAFVNCSLSDGMPLPVLEAMASGLACVCARTIGMLELIREGSNGLLVEPENAHELAGALLRLMDDDGLRSRLAVYGRSRILQKYCLTRTSERFGSLFQTRLSTRKSQRRKSVLGSMQAMKVQWVSDTAD